MAAAAAGALLPAAFAAHAPPAVAAGKWPYDTAAPVAADAWRVLTNQHPGAYVGADPQPETDARKVYFSDPTRGTQRRGALPLYLGLSGNKASGWDACGTDLEDTGGKEYTDAGTGIFTFDMFRNAAALGFVAACPDMIGSAQSIGGSFTNGSWNAGACCAPASTSTLNYPDVGFVRSTVEYARGATDLSEISKVYAIGLSGGAQMAWRLGCEAHDVVDGIVVVGGGWFGSPAFHGTPDTPAARDWEITKENCTDGVPGEPQCWRVNNPYLCSAPKRDFRILFVMGTGDFAEPYNTTVAMFHHYATKVLGCSGWVRAGALEKYGNASATGNADGPFMMDSDGPHPTTCYTYQTCSSPSRPALCSVEGMTHHNPSVEEFDLMRASWEWFGES